MDGPDNRQASVQGESPPLAILERIGFGKLSALTILRSARYLVGIAPPSQSGYETAWSECALDLVVWAGVFVTCGVLLYLIYHGLELSGLL